MPDTAESTVCPQCGAELRQGMLRCRECGTSLVGRSPQPAPSRPASKGASEGAPAAGETPEVSADESAPGELAPGEVPRRRFANPLSRRVLLGGAAAAGATLTLGWLLSRKSLPREVTSTLTARGERLTCVVFSRSGKHLFAGAASGNVFAWELPQGAPVALPGETKEPILAIATAGDGFLVAGGVDPSLFLWDHATDPSKRKARTESGFPASITCIALRPGKSEMALGLANGALALIGKRKPATKSSAHANGVRAVAWSPDGGTLVTGGVEGTVVWRSPDTADPLGPPVQFPADIGSLALSPDGALTVAGDWNGHIEWFETATRKQTAQIDQPDAVSALAITERLVVSTSWDGRLRCWSRASQELVYEGNAHEPLVGLSVTTNGELAATVSNASRVLVWRLP